MATMSSELYDAFRDAGASEEKARKAAEAVAGLDGQHREMRGEFNTVKWMVATTVTMTLLVPCFMFLAAQR